MQKVGIDRIGLYVPPFYMDLKTLAQERQVDSNKFYLGLGQYQMAVPSPDEDIVTMAANSADRVLQGIDLNDIEMLLFATESGIDHSKAAGIYVHRLLNLPSRCRVIELKQACYSATAAIQMAVPLIRQFPHKKVLVIASDVARYGLSASAEPSQGAGAVALLLTTNPRILALDAESGFYTEDVMDFWRPYYLDEAIVEGKYSCDVYIRVLLETWKQYTELSLRSFTDLQHFCYHTPVPRLVEKAHKRLVRHNKMAHLTDEQLLAPLQSALIYPRIIGNCYTASLYLNFLSLLDNNAEDLSGHRVGFYSYGSGCVGEYFSGQIQPGYRDQCDSVHNQTSLAQRIELSYAQYQEFYQFPYPKDGSTCMLPNYIPHSFRLASIHDHQRKYEALNRIQAELTV